MNSRIYISTNSFCSSNLTEIFSEALKNNISNIELASGLHPDPTSNAISEKRPKEIALLVHNYFPPEPSKMVINLASSDKGKRKRSLDFCKNAIDICDYLNVPIYSVHSGFCIDPESSDLGKRQTTLPRTEKGRAYKLFFDSLVELLDYSKNKDITLSIENNVIESRNLIKGQNLTELMASPEDYKHFIAEKSLSDVMFLVDFGHMKVSANSLRFSEDDFIDLVKERTALIHISENDGKTDSHMPIGNSSHMLQYLKKMDNAIVVLESKNLSTDDIFKSITAIEQAIN